MATGLDILFGMRTDGLDPVRAPRDPIPCALPRCIIMACRVARSAALTGGLAWLRGRRTACHMLICRRVRLPHVLAGSAPAGARCRAPGAAQGHVASTPSFTRRFSAPSRWSREPSRRLPCRPAPGELRSVSSPGALSRAGEPSGWSGKAAVHMFGLSGRIAVCAVTESACPHRRDGMAARLLNRLPCAHRPLGSPLARAGRLCASWRSSASSRSSAGTRRARRVDMSVFDG